jgi:large subunit ribosomal protein L22
MAEERAATFNASHRFARISARKARLVMDTIRGDPVGKALMKLRYSPRRASPMISKVVRSALANATQKAGVQEDDLIVWRAFVDGGPISKRWKPRAQGRAYPRLRRTCHLCVVLRQVEKAEKKRRGTRALPAVTQSASSGPEVVASRSAETGAEKEKES